MSALRRPERLVLILAVTKPDLISFKEARSRIRAAAEPRPPEEMVLAEAVGMPCASDIEALADYPRWHTSAMDGFAVRARDTLAASPNLPVRLSLDRSHALAVSTGSPVPLPFDAVIMAERLVSRDEALFVSTPIQAGLNVRRQAEDGRKGEVLLVTGEFSDPCKIAALANFGVTRVLVRRPPTVGLLVTGDEIGGGDQGVFDANGPMAEAFCRLLEVRLIGPVRCSDSAADIRDSIVSLEERGAGLVLTTGGTSIGARDRLAESLQALDAEMLFHGVRMRPGKPSLMARLPSGALLFGLSGPPTAALIGLRFFVVEALRAMLGRHPEQGETVSGTPITDAMSIAVVWPGQGGHQGGSAWFRPSPRHRPQRVRSLLSSNAWLVEQRNYADSYERRLFPWLPR